MRQITVILLFTFFCVQHTESQIRKNTTDSEAYNTNKVCLNVVQNYAGITDMNLSYDELVNAVISYLGIQKIDKNDSLCNIHILIDAKGNILEETRHIVITNTNEQKLAAVNAGVKMWWDVSIIMNESSSAKSFTGELKFKYLTFKENSDFEPSLEPIQQGYKDLLWTTAFLENFGKFIAKSINLNELVLFAHILKNQNKDIRILAIQIIESLDDPQTFDIIRQAMNDSEAGVRLQATRSMLALENESRVASLIPMLNDVDPSVRIKAAKALGDQADTLAVKPLIKVLNDESIFVTINAAEALGKLKDKSAIDPLFQTLDRIPKNRQTLIIIALGQLGDPRSVEYLIPILKGKYKSKEAWMLLKQLTDQNFDADYKQWNTWYKRSK